MKQLCSHFTDFNEKWYLNLFRKYVEKIQVSFELTKITAALMKTNLYLWYIAEFFLEWEMFETKVVEEIKIHILCAVTFFNQKSCHLWDNVEKCCRAGQATYDSAMQWMCIVCRITKAKNTHSEYVILTAFLLQQWLKYLLLFCCNSGWRNAPHCYILCTVHCLSYLI